MKRLQPLTVFWFCLAASACSPDESNKCQDLEAWLDNRARELERDCTENADCAVVWIRPDSPSAASSYAEDASVRRVRREFSQQCSENLYGSGVEFIPPAGSDGLGAICQPQLQDQQLPDGTIVEVEVGRECVLSGEVADAPRIDAGVEDVETADTCSCSSAADCGGSPCIGCSCVAAGDCATVCSAVFECSLQDDLNTGSTGAACVASCEARAVQDSASVSVLSGCAAGSPCESLPDCF
jgi:hypothetical protein